MTKQPEDSAPRGRQPLLNRRQALAVGAVGLAAGTFAIERALNPSYPPPEPQTPTLPCGTLLIGGGNTSGMFNTLDKSGLLPGGGGWDRFLNNKKVICMGCGAGDVKAKDDQNAVSIEAWCQKQKRFYVDKQYRFVKKFDFTNEKGPEFYKQNGVKEKDIIFIKDADYNIKNEATIIEAIKDPNTVFVDCSGGDQDLQMKILNRTPAIKEALKQRWITDPNFLVYTTSASAAALSKHMMSEGHIREGLGWLENIVVDMHMLRSGSKEPENRVPRLQKGVKKCCEEFDPGIVGIGVDEATALILRRENKVVRGKPVEQMTGTVLAAIDDEGKTRFGSCAKRIMCMS